MGTSNVWTFKWKYKDFVSGWQNPTDRFKEMLVSNLRGTESIQKLTRKK